ncbi:exostosin-3-like [Limulus polyphemus]|uniref:Exostosin-3-like n=1 Tax=Limulus polyphemus TaxID=6850 RepID=A0ABM1BSH7_LIMPO|nr:exostosin-3-like [Limulus polyphemus]XP_022256040.1 exostosin-3-like [Limulus polyphemus]XP_022256041.1 exostosin-3-like [Limulus polyphemus]
MVVDLPSTGTMQTPSFCHWLTAMRLSRLIGLLLVVLVIVPLITHYYLSKFVGELQNSDGHQKGIEIEDLNSLKLGDLKSRIEEMLRIKTSVSNELRSLESHRQKLQAEITTINQKLEKMKTEYGRLEVELQKLRLSVEQAQYEQKEALERNIPHIAAPNKILPSLLDNVILDVPSLNKVKTCRMHSCFDYSRCSVASGFPVYFYHPDDYRLSWNQLQKIVKKAVTESLNTNIHVTFDPMIACIFVVLVGQVEVGNYNKLFLEKYLHSLTHWGGDGRNHILLNLASSSNTSDIFTGVNTGRAIIVQSHFLSSSFRDRFDIIVPPLILHTSQQEIWREVPLLSPARRKYLLSFQGEQKNQLINSHFKYVQHLQSHNKSYYSNDLTGISPLQEDVDSSLVNSRRLMKVEYSSDSSDNQVINVLKQMISDTTNDKFWFEFSCPKGTLDGEISEWLLCADQTREEMLKDSTFTLILSPLSYNIVSSVHLQFRLFEAFKNGAIPVILGNYIRLPFDEFVDWKQAVLELPKARVTELHYILRTFTDSDILLIKNKGRLLWERYLSTTQQVIDTTLALLRSRIGIPAVAVRDEPSPSVFNETFKPLKLTTFVLTDSEVDESLGPLEPPFPSPTFRRNYSIPLTQQVYLWNNLVNPFFLYPHTPFDPVLPSEAKFTGSGYGFRPIRQGEGGAGKEFSEALGGNVPREQFTVVMLTYERETVMIDSLQRLKGLPYLNKVIVVWNSPKPPIPELRWPEIGVPIHVIKSQKNSLNNRFLPYVAIETEAILSVDDDAHLRHDEIIFGFRVWREERDRIVGFPGRYHAWDPHHGGWLYNSNHSCELSMVLTGAAFFHKYYAYLYTHLMPQAIKDKVDEYMNCEDIAMNFLVSHVTRKPPVKVTSRWTFRCPGCPISLSEEDSHFQERHKCINFFAQVYGYIPLLNTQFRVDSVLFKTRIPHDKQKCFKFI